MKNYTTLEKYRLIEPILNNEIPIRKVSEQHHIPYRTILYWKKQFLAEGYLGLERKTRKDKGKARSLIPELMKLIEALVLQKPNLTTTGIYQQVKEYAQEQSLKPPRYGTVYSYIKSIDPALITLAHQGSKGYRQKYELIFRRECKISNQMWQVDHTLLDIYLLDNKAQVCRPWLTIVMDDYSRAICGYYLSFEAPSSLHTALALRKAIWIKQDPSWPICGIPQVLYTDHGTDFMSLHIEQVCLRLKIEMVNSIVGRPQGRGKIERFFETINECVLLYLPGYSLKGKTQSKPKLSLEALKNILETFFIKKYHHTKHGTTGQEPIQRWATNGFLPQLPSSLQVLDQLLLSVDRPRKMQRDGIRFQGLRYMAITLAGFVGEQVTIKYDPGDIAEIQVYHQDEFLCTAICQEIAEMVVSLKEIQKARKQVKKERYNKIKESKELLKNMQKKDRQDSFSSQAQIPRKTTALKSYKND